MPAILLTFLAKDWKYLAIIAGLLFAVGYAYHSGQTRVKDADTKAAAAQIAHNNEVKDEIQSKVDAAVKDYDALSPIPVPVRVPVLVCRDASGAVPKSARAASGSDVERVAVPVSAEPAGEGFNPAPAVSATGTAADKEIDHLQKKIDLLQSIIDSYQDAGLVSK